MYFYKGFNENICTFETSGQVEAGQPVSVCENCTVKATENGMEFHGVAVNSRNGAASVQLTGYVELPYTGSAIQVGMVSLAADGQGGVVLNENGKKVLAVSVDTEKAIVGIIL